MELIEGLCYKGSEACAPVFPTSSTWRLLTKGHKVSADTCTAYMSHVVDTLGYSGDQPFAAPSDARSVPHFFSVTTQEQPHDKWLPFVVSNYPRDSDSFAAAGAQERWSVKKQLLATTAAPTYFPPVVEPGTGVQHVDGGIVANNPAAIALQEARAIWPGRPVGCVLSIGTGTSVATEQSKAGLTYWAGKMLSMPTDTYRVHKEVQATLRHFNGPDNAQPCYFRLEPVIPNLELDECRKYVLDEMRRTTGEYIAAKSAKIDRLCSVLQSLSCETGRIAGDGAIDQPSQVML